VRQGLALLAAALTLLGAAAASAEPAESDEPPPAPLTTPSAPAVPTTAAPAKTAAAGSLDFDLLGDASKTSQTPAQLKLSLAIERKVQLRRKMLTAHQALGFSTLAVFAATLIIGQLNYQDKYVSGDYTGRYERSHLGLSIATTGLFATTGLLAVFAPNPYPKKYRLDSAMVHRVAMALASAGMVTQMILGPVVAARAGRLDQPGLALAHLVTGYSTFAFMAAGTLAYVF
jgi:hypothetical protein